MTEEVHKHFKEKWQEASRAFIVVLVSNIHVDTGMSRASTIPLAEKANLRLIILGRKAKKGRTDMNKIYYSNKYKSESEGIKLGKRAGNLNFGSKSRPVFRLWFRVPVYQYAVHEPVVGYANEYTQYWQSIGKASKAFKDIFNQIWKPNIKQWMFENG